MAHPLCTEYDRLSYLCGNVKFFQSLAAVRPFPLDRNNRYDQTKLRSGTLM